MEKIIYFGCITTFYSKKQDKDFYLVHYLDDEGRARQDYISKTEYDAYEKKNIAPGTKKIGLYGIDAYRNIYLQDVK